MKLFLDTNVLAAASLLEHEHHTRALPILESIHKGDAEGCLSGHSLLEVYAILTRLPRTPRLSSLQAGRLIEENVTGHLSVVSLSAREYEDLVRRLSKEGISGGQVYDALHFACAAKCKADRFYTFNVRHFEAVSGRPGAPKIVSP